MRVREREIKGKAEGRKERNLDKVRNEARQRESQRVIEIKIGKL